MYNAVGAAIGLVRKGVTGLCRTRWGYWSSFGVTRHPTLHPPLPGRLSPLSSGPVRAAEAQDSPLVLPYSFLASPGGGCNAPHADAAPAGAGKPRRGASELLPRGIRRRADRCKTPRGRARLTGRRGAGVPRSTATPRVRGSGGGRGSSRRPGAAPTPTAAARSAPRRWGGAGRWGRYRARDTRATPPTRLGARGRSAALRQRRGRRWQAGASRARSVCAAARGVSAAAALCPPGAGRGAGLRRRLPAARRSGAAGETAGGGGRDGTGSAPQRCRRHFPAGRSSAREPDLLPETLGSPLAAEAGSRRSPLPRRSAGATSRTSPEKTWGFPTPQAAAPGVLATGRGGKTFPSDRGAASGARERRRGGRSAAARPAGRPRK